MLKGYCAAIGPLPQRARPRRYQLLWLVRRMPKVSDGGEKLIRKIGSIETANAHYLAHGFGKGHSGYFLIHTTYLPRGFAPRELLHALKAPGHECIALNRVIL